VLQDPRARSWAPAEAFAYCQRMALSHYENFTVASWLLPREARRHIRAVYAFLVEKERCLTRGLASPTRPHARGRPHPAAAAPAYRRRRSA
jgi:hypothetical protein